MLVRPCRYLTAGSQARSHPVDLSVPPVVREGRLEGSVWRELRNRGLGSVLFDEIGDCVSQIDFDRDLRHIRGIDFGVIVGNADSHPRRQGQRPVYMLRVSCQVLRWRRWSFSLLRLCVVSCREDDRDACSHLSRLCAASVTSYAVNVTARTLMLPRLPRPSRCRRAVPVLVAGGESRFR